MVDDIIDPAGQRRVIIEHWRVLKQTAARALAEARRATV